MYTFQYYRGGDLFAPPYQRFIFADGSEMEGSNPSDAHTVIYYLEDDGREFPSGIQMDNIAASLSMIGLGVQVVCHFECPELIIEEPLVWCYPPTVHLYRETAPHPVKVNYTVNEAGQLIGHANTRCRPGEVTILLKGNGPNIMQGWFLNQLDAAGCEFVPYFQLTPAA